MIPVQDNVFWVWALHAFPNWHNHNFSAYSLVSTLESNHSNLSREGQIENADSGTRRWDARYRIHSAELDTYTSFLNSGRLGPWVKHINHGKQRVRKFKIFFFLWTGWADHFLLSWNAFPKFLCNWNLNLSLNPAWRSYLKYYHTSHQKTTIRQRRALGSQTSFPGRSHQLHWAGFPSTSQVTEGFGWDRKGRLVLKVSVLMRKFRVVAPDWERPFSSRRVFNLKAWSRLMWRARGWEAAFEITPRYRPRIKARRSIPPPTLFLVVSK